MPSCRPDLIPEVLYRVMNMRPTKILDIGVGYGKWGILCDEYLRYWCNIEPEIDGVEAFENYRSPAYGVYRSVFSCDIITLLDCDIIEGYDLVLMVDVIEHLDRESGRLLLDKSQHYIVATPGYSSLQGEVFGNKYERHVSEWTESDFDNSKLVKNIFGKNHVIGWK